MKEHEEMLMNTIIDDMNLTESERENLKKALKCFLTKLNENKKILFHVKGGVRVVHISDVYYVEINDRKIKVVTKTEEFEASNSMTELETILEPHGYVRCHKSFLVNLEYVSALYFPILELANGYKIPVSKRRMKEVKIKLSNFFKN